MMLFYVLMNRFGKNLIYAMKKRLIITLGAGVMIHQMKSAK